MPSTSSRSIEPPRLIGWGLHIVSDIAIPGTMVLPTSDTSVNLPPDLTIAFGTPDRAADGRAEGPYRLSDDGFTFTMPDVACYACTPTTILIDPAPGARDDHVAAMLIATAIPALLWLRGEIVLHGAAAILPGTTHAVAVLGPSGSGKSTLLARAVAAGARIVADDSICIRPTANGFRVSGLPGGYFEPLAAVGGDRRFHSVAPDRQVADAALGGLIVLDESGPAGRLSGAVAVGAILIQRHRPRIARMAGRERVAFAAIAQLARTVPIFRSGPRGGAEASS